MSKPAATAPKIFVVDAELVEDTDALAATALLLLAEAEAEDD